MFSLLLNKIHVDKRVPCPLSLSRSGVINDGLEDISQGDPSNMYDSPAFRFLSKTTNGPNDVNSTY